MTYIRKLCVLSLYLFKGLIEDDVYELLAKMIQLRSLLLQLYQTKESIAQVSNIDFFLGVRVCIRVTVILCNNMHMTNIVAEKGTCMDQTGDDC